MAAEPVKRLLGQSPELAPLAERLQRIKRLQERFRTIAPGPLAAACRVCAIEGTTVVIGAANGTVASVLRQLAPRLLENLRSGLPKHPEDQQFTEMRVEVQVSAPAPKTRVAGRAAMPHGQLLALAATLSDSPLKAQLERMARAQMASKTRSKT
jgi:hypothetical protein